MLSAEKVNLTELKSAIREFNEAGLVEEKIKFVGIKGDDLIETFVKTIESLPEEKHSEVPQSSVEMYNFVTSDEVTLEEEPEETEAEPEETEAEPEETEAEPEEGVASDIGGSEKESEEKSEKLEPEPEPEPVKEKKKKEKKENPKKFRVGLKTFENFDAYKKDLLENGPDTPTTYMDFLYVQGLIPKDGPALFKAYLEENNLKHSGYKTERQVIEHMETRRDRSGFLFEKQGAIYTMVGRKS